MVFSNVCRTCLSTKALNPIFKIAEDRMRYSSALFLSAGVKVDLDDGLPQHMCMTCITSLNNCLKFRRQCRNAEAQLLEIKERLAQNGGLFEDEMKREVDFHTDPLEINTSYSDNEAFDEEKHNFNKGVYFDDNNISNTNENDEKHLSEEISKDKPKLKTERVTCQLCSQSLAIRSVAAHMAKRHPGLDSGCLRCGDLICVCGFQHCKTEFDSKEVLIEHVKTCTAKKRRRSPHESIKEMTECDECHKSMQKASLKMHKAVKHAGLGPVCEHCGRRFGNKFRLNEHYRAKHGYEKFKCSYCEFQSAGVMAMRNHERRHRGEKPFICETCGVKFHAAYLLAQHKQSHRTEKIHKCDLCPASFKANNSLHMHKASCHSSTMYKCAMCDRAYPSRHYAVKHMRHVHRYSGAVPKLQMLPNSVERSPNEETKGVTPHSKNILIDVQ